MAEDEILRAMTNAADSILLDESAGNLNLLVFHVVVGSYVDEISRPRNMHHEFPILAERLICAPLGSFSSSMMELVSSVRYHHINIYQRIILIDYAYNKPQYTYTDGNMLPDNIIRIMENILPGSVSEKDYSVMDNIVSLEHLVELGAGNITRIKICTEFEIFPYRVEPSLLTRIESIYPVLSYLFPNTLITYFDMSGEHYENSPLFIGERCQSIYSLKSDCMMNYDDPITSPFIIPIASEEGISGFAWYNIPDFNDVDTVKLNPNENPNLVVFAKRYYDYLYRDNLVPLFLNSILPYIRRKSAFHPCTGVALDLESIPITEHSMDDYLDVYLIPFIRYRLGKYHHNYGLMMWYLEHFRDIRRHRRAMLVVMASDKSPLPKYGSTLLNVIQAEMEYLGRLIPF